MDLIVRCVVCDPPREDDLPIYSHGICLPHLIEWAKGKQRTEGNPDCCGEKRYYCDRDSCKWKWICNKNAVNLKYKNIA